MDTYSLLRGFADSWFLIAMFSFFIGVGIWVYWPSQRGARQDAASIPFKDEKSCSNDCANCACKTDFLKGTQDV